MSQKATRLTTDSGEDDRDIAEPRLGRGEPREIREEFEARLRFETLIADLSSEFVDVPPADVDRLIEDAQRRVCQCLDIDLAGLWQWSAEEPGFLGLTHLYRSEEGHQTHRSDGLGGIFSLVPAATAAGLGLRRSLRPSHG